MSRRLRIAIATAGRFHVLDLARELDALGHHVRFYSYVPAARARRFGLPDRCRVSLLPFVLPAIAWERLLPCALPRVRERLLYLLLNYATILRLRRCDIFICMSGIYLEAARVAKRRYGTQVWLHRGSRHILSQDEILSAIPGAERPSPLAICRELAGYALADRVVIPSHHVQESFRAYDFTDRKLFLNPYGTDLAMFPLAQGKVSTEPFTCLFVGTWCLRKGCDLLVKAVQQTPDVSLIHVGPIGDLDFPRDDNRLIHMGPVPQQELARFYAAADIFVLASREEGFGVVLAQALASGLPVICTDRTGGANLAHTPALAERISVIPHDDLTALVSAILVWHEKWLSGKWPDSISSADRETLRWAAYARRYSDEIDRCFADLSLHINYRAA